MEKIVILICEDAEIAKAIWMNDSNKITYINITEAEKRGDIVKAIDELS